MAVLSFDLVSDNGYVIEANACVKLPLLGSEGEGEGRVVDAMVSALSLMGTGCSGIDCNDPDRHGHRVHHVLLGHPPNYVMINE
jgi:hypothetical protein